MDHVVTLIIDRESGRLTEATISRVRDAVRGGTSVPLSPGEAVDIPCPAPPDPALLRAALAGQPIDAIVQPATGRRKRLLVADMDSTIVQNETLDDLAAHAGVRDRVAALTARSMNGEADFASSLRERVALLAGLRLEALAATWRATRLTPGAIELVATMRAHGAFTALVSGGFTFFTARVAEAAGFDLHCANTLLDNGACLTGQVAEPILDREGKRATLRHLAAEHALASHDTLAIGDGANDLDMLRAAGFGIAFHATPLVAAEAGARIDHAGLRAALFAQGYRAAEFRPG